MDEITPVAPGDRVVYVDPTGTAHEALVTNVFGEFGPYTEEQVEEMIARHPKPADVEENYRALIGTAHTVPSVNVVFVSDDPTQTDPYGRQIARQTSIPHESVQPAHGMKWRNA